MYFVEISYLFLKNNESKRQKNERNKDFFILLTMYIMNYEYDHFNSFSFFHFHYFNTFEILRFKESLYFYENII